MNIDTITRVEDAFDGPTCQVCQAEVSGDQRGHLDWHIAREAEGRVTLP